MGDPTPQKLYTGDFGGYGIFQVAPDGTFSVFYNGDGAGAGLGFDQSGNLFSTHGEKIVKITPDGKGTIFASGFKNTCGLTVDSLNNVYCTEYEAKTGALYKFTPDGKRTTLDSGLTWPYGLSSDANGNVYLGILGNRITKYTQTGSKVDMGPLASWGRTAIMDFDGGFFTVGFNVTRVANGQTIGMFAPGVDLNHSVGLALDNSGNLYETNSGERAADFSIKENGLIFKYTPDGRRTVFCHLGLQPFWLAFYPPTIVPSPNRRALSQETSPSSPPNSLVPAPAANSHTNLKDGAEKVFVAAGPFVMGADPLTDSEQRKAVNTPKHTVTLDAYWIYKYDVTVAQYRKFCQSIGQQMPTAPSWGWRDDNPIVNVSWSDADQYAKWAGAALPTEAQWEKAARGMDERKYPWGNDWDPKRCVHSTKRWGDQMSTASIGSREGGASPYGVMDMAGNVWNWCSDWYGENYYSASPAANPPGAPWFVDTPSGKVWSAFRIVRGGAWCLCDPKDFSTVDRDWAAAPDYQGNDVGFRCVTLQ